MPYALIGSYGIASSVAGNVEFRIRRSDGSAAWISCRGMVIRDEEGKPRRMIGVYSDTTRRKSEEAQLIVQRCSGAAKNAPAVDP